MGSTKESTSTHKNKHKHKHKHKHKDDSGSSDEDAGKTVKKPSIKSASKPSKSGLKQGKDEVDLSKAAPDAKLKLKAKVTAAKATKKYAGGKQYFVLNLTAVDQVGSETKSVYIPVEDKTVISKKDATLLRKATSGGEVDDDTRFCIRTRPGDPPLGDDALEIVRILQGIYKAQLKTPTVFPIEVVGLGWITTIRSAF